MAARILVVDDSEIVLGVSKAVLERAGYEVTTNRRATGSVALILQTKPDLVLLDVNMPSLRGDMIARMSAATNSSNRTVVVLHSTLSVKELQRMASESGADGFIQKTENTHIFLRQVRQFLEDAEQQRNHGSPVPSERDPFPSSRKRAKLEGILLVDGDMTALSSLRRQVQDLGYTPSFALSAKQAWSKIETTVPDVIVVSDRMPELARFMRGLSSYAGRLVLVRDQSRTPLDVEFSQVLSRPVSKKRLGEALEFVIQRSRAQS